MDCSIRVSEPRKWKNSLSPRPAEVRIIPSWPVLTTLDPFSKLSKRIRQNMLAGIQKRQFVLLVLAVCVPLTANIVALWQEIGTASLLKIWNGAYPAPMLGFLGGSYNPLPEIFLKLLYFDLALGLLAWLMVFISNRAFFQKQPPVVKLFENVLIAGLVAVAFAIITGFFMPLVWLPEFHNYLLGLPASHTLIAWSFWLIFPITTILLLGTIFLSGRET